MFEPTNPLKNIFILAIPLHSVFSVLQNPFIMFLLAFPGGAEWILLIGLSYLFALFFLVATIWKRTDLEQNTKLLWTIFVFMAHIIAMIIYALFGRQNRGINQ